MGRTSSSKLKPLENSSSWVSDSETRGKIFKESKKVIREMSQ